MRPQRMARTLPELQPLQAEWPAASQHLVARASQTCIPLLPSPDRLWMSSLSHIVRGALPAFWALPLPLTVKPLHHLFRCGFIVSFYYSNYIKLGRAAGIISTHPHPTPKQALAIGDSEKSLCFPTFSNSASLTMG